MHRPRPNQLRSVSEIRTDYFYERFKLVGNHTIARVPLPPFRFVVDGFAASTALAEHTELDRDDDEIRELILKRQVLPDDLIVESLIVPTFSVNPSEPKKYNSSLERLGAKYWKDVCEKLRTPESHEITLQSFSEHEGNQRRSIDVRYREPLALPFSPNDSHIALYVPPVAQSPLATLLSDPTKRPLVPKSAIFFASRFHRLRELGRQHQVMKRALEEPPIHSRANQPTKEDLEAVLEEIYRVLLSSALYSTAMFGSQDGAERLGFSAEVWIETFELGDKHGSEAFGTREGIELNGEFLLNHHHDLEEWDRKAVGLWCPGQSQLDVDNRKLLLNALEEMETELLAIFKGIHDLQSHHKRRGRARPTSPLHNPFSVDAREKDESI